MKKKILTTSLLILGLILSSLYFINRSKTEESYKNGELNVLNWTSYLPNDVISDFEREFNIKVNYGTYSSNEELLAKLSSSNEGTYDLVFPSDYMVDLMIRRELINKLDFSKLKNLKNLNQLFLDQPFDPENNFSLPFLLAYTVLIYDQSKIEEKIVSYQDLLNEKYQNNIILIDDQRIIIGASLLATGAEMNSTNEKDLARALNFFEQLKPNIKAFDSDSPKTFLITKETEIGLIWNAEASLAKNENENLKIVYPREGFALSMDNFVLPKNSKNRENAYKFIDFLLRDNISRRIIDEYPYVSPNNSTLKGQESEIETIFKNGSYVENVGEDIKKLDKLWTRFK